jgi:hypothetical protein|tara:strand:- start:29 stop:1078 length:1050 start_codon:yes stop_codon:yes gene_type:complete
MTIKASGSQLSFGEIETEFGQNDSRSLGDYRKITELPDSSSLPDLPLDTGIPTGSNDEIKFSDFYGKQLNIVVDCHSGTQEDRIIAKNDKWNNNNVTVIGGFRPKKEAGSRIFINVNKRFNSNNEAQSRCALRTGTWNSTATVSVDIGSNAKLFGSGGNGGAGQNGVSSSPTAAQKAGKPGSSCLGIQSSNITVNIASGALLRCGFGGGGGGGGGRQTDKGKDRRASGGGGGGGAGSPPGQGGAGGPVPSGSGDSSSPSDAGGSPGGNGTLTTGGGGGGGGDNQGEAGGAKGGKGGEPNNTDAQAGTGGNSPGTAGARGAAIRRSNGLSGIVINPGGTIIGSTTATGVS